MYCFPPQWYQETQQDPHKPCLQQFPRVTSIGSLPPKTFGKSRGPPQNPAEPRRTLGETPRRTLGETPQPSERKMSSESLAEGCAPRMVTLRNFRTVLSLI